MNQDSGGRQIRSPSYTFSLLFFSISGFSNSRNAESVSLGSIAALDESWVNE